MRIDGAPHMIAKVLTALPRAAETFRPGEEADTRTRPPVAGPSTHAATSVEILVALASADPSAERRRRQAAEVDRGLRLLEQLHRQLIQGPVAPERLRVLEGWAEGFRPPDDPRLAEIARDLALRVRVELAKHEVRL